MIVAAESVVSHVVQSRDPDHGPPASRYCGCCAKVQARYSMGARFLEVLPLHVQQILGHVRRGEQKVRLMAAPLLGHVADHQVILDLGEFLLVGSRQARRLDVRCR